MNPTKNLLKDLTAKADSLLLNPVVRDIATLAHLLELSCFTPGLQPLKVFAEKTVGEIAPEQRIPLGEAILKRILPQLIERIPVYADLIRKALQSPESQNNKWLENDFGPTAQYMCENLDKVAENSLQATILMALHSYYWDRDLGLNILSTLAELFIAYAPLELICIDDMLNYHAKIYYRLYVDRLPADELHEFLTSEVKGARIMAKNKVVGDLLG